MIRDRAAYERLRVEDEHHTLRELDDGSAIMMLESLLASSLLALPRRDRWSDAFQLVDARIVARTAAARATVRLLQLNRPERVAERAVLVAAAILRSPG